VAVYESLAGSGGHPTAEELFRLVKSRAGRLSLATVYNALEALIRVGLVRRMATTSGCCRYDADTSAHSHVCFGHSAEVLDVPPDLSARLLACLPQKTLDEISDRMGVDIDAVSIQLHARSPGPNRAPARGDDEGETRSAGGARE
jgi:Fe2+ or Zn2+ uptake regulation protein